MYKYVGVVPDDVISWRAQAGEQHGIDIAKLAPYTDRDILSCMDIFLKTDMTMIQVYTANKPRSTCTVRGIQAQPGEAQASRACRIQRRDTEQA